ncbi:MAG: hypothetical protein Ct9H90mP19_5640 [Gammaproteobacteria bacterium]|nr:MAG: hypothetical protein Ct9H90mP19_5640 [Gammaproteobacteria bacterium]
MEVSALRKVYLAASGIGKINLVDPDKVEIRNLQDKFSFKTRCGRHKVDDFKIILKS